MEKENYFKFTPDLVESLKPEQVFVFGRNLVGCHSGGTTETPERSKGLWDKMKNCILV